MSSLYYLTIYYTKYLLRKKIFINCALILLIIAYFIIPNKEASYVTFYINNTAAIPNKYWIGNLGAVFSNFAISLLIFFIILDERENEIKRETFQLEDTSDIKKILLYSHKIFSIFIISLLYLFILNLGLYIINFKEISLFPFILPILYFCFPYLFVISVLAFIVEYFITIKGLKYIVYFSLIIFILPQDKYLFNIMGISELVLYLGKYVHSYDYGAGILLKSDDLRFIEIRNQINPLFVWHKFIWILASLLLIIIISKFKISRKLSVVDEDKIGTNINASVFNKTNFIFGTKIKQRISFSTLLLKDSFMLFNAFGKINLFTIIIFWCALYIAPLSINRFLLPLLFLFCLPVNSNFLCKLFFYDLNYLEKQSPFKKQEIISSKVIVLFLMYIILLTPYLLRCDDLIKIVCVILCFLFLAVVQTLITNYLKNNVLIDIIYIIIFASYIAGQPILNILQL